MTDLQASSVGIALIFAFIAGGYAWETIRTVHWEYQQMKAELRQLKSDNYQLQDELARLRHKHQHN